MNNINKAQPCAQCCGDALCPRQRHPLRARHLVVACVPFSLLFAMERKFSYDLLWGSLKKNGRRRSLKTLFQLPLSARASSYGTLSTTTSVGSIPVDIVREIVDLMSPSDILSFSLTVRRSLSSFIPDIEVLGSLVKAYAGAPASCPV